MRYFWIILFLCVPNFVLADAELHAIGVYEGNIRTDGRIHGPEVRVLVDRTENPVILSIASYEPVRWFIETTEGTEIETVFLNGHEPEKSEVYLNGEQIRPHILGGVRASHRNEGRKFRRLLDVLQRETGLGMLSSFHGSYSATPEPFVVNRIVLDVRNRVDHLKEEVRPEAVPDTLRPFLDLSAQLSVPQVRFTNTGFTLTEGDETTVIPLSLDVPDISHPTGAAYDQEGGRMFGVTFGGEGFIYQYDMGEDQWSILTSMEQVDAISMLYDAEKNQLILGLGVVSSGMMVYDLEQNTFSRLPVQTGDFFGFTDLYDPGNGPNANLFPLAVSGDLLLVRAFASRHFGTQAEKSRTYLVNMQTGAVTLVAYSNGGAP